jgi:excisionase family DNA binding protein
MTYLTIRETADRCRVSTKTVRRWVASGALRAVRAGSRRLLVSPDTLARFLTPAS